MGSTDQQIWQSKVGWADPNLIEQIKGMLSTDPTLLTDYYLVQMSKKINGSKIKIISQLDRLTELKSNKIVNQKWVTLIDPLVKRKIKVSNIRSKVIRFSLKVLS